ncbi:helix-turn-helix transcriptional regulator [Actinosynnema pretiosum subsp. pretiosum]|uniref:Helix-turn-helix transcriptional regulator n=1 Tax=Actinosynnema pretiosum subsp. pretiosum TaxID=103721 RepID=A0AA45L6Y2_9PSEU|nr:helix-turn-helix transcriptional regulator [Actinosynnema pretiosum subsp. pretiosum]
MQNEQQDDTSPSSGWYSFVAHHIGHRGWSGPDFQRATGIPRGRLTAWREGGQPSVENARAFARGLGLSIATVFVAAGFATADELGGDVTIVDGADLASVPTASLRRELRRREEKAAVAHERALALLEAGDAEGAARELRSAQTPPSDADIAADPTRYSVGSLAPGEAGGSASGHGG